MICLNCKQEFNTKTKRVAKFCSRKCYFSFYYKNNKEELNAKRIALHHKTYVPHPITPLFETKEEYKEYHKKQANQYYNNHKDYYRQKNKEWYANHKDDEQVKARHKLACQKYYQKRKLLDN